MSHTEFNVYRGLQKPFVLFGLKGKNIGWGFGGFFVTLFVFIVTAFFLPMIYCFLIAGLVGGFCGYKIWYYTKYGIHSKEKMNGIWIPKNLIRSTFR